METVIRRRGRSALYVLSASLLSFTSHSAVAAGVLPTGGNFAAGSGKISSTANTLTVNQTTKNGIINWTGFSIGQGETVRINNGSGATLNRVTGTSPSSISGWLTSSGSTYLVNQNGIVVTPTGKVISGGSFVGSTRDTSNSAFMGGAGNLEFAGTSSGTVANQGSIAASGDAVLIGKSATNSGSISAANGTVGVVAGDDVVLQPSSSGLQIEVKTGSGNATTSGNIIAAQALIDSAGGNAYALAGNNSGVVRATGTKTINGHVWLIAPNGTAQVTGTIDAQNNNGSGGAINVQGQSINVSGTLNASDTASKGNGGEITVGSATTPSTTVTGILTANAGAKGGNGGQVETSGEQLSTSGAKVTASAPKGIAGSWTLDPYDLTVDSAAASTIDSTLNSGTNVALQTTASSTSGPGNANAAGNGDIFIDSPISWSTPATLSLTAYRNINVDAAITISGAGSLSLTFGTGTSGTDIFGVGGNISFSGGPSSGASLRINGAPYSLIYNMGQLQNINNDLSANYALANSINAATDPTTPASWASLGTNGASTILDQYGFAGFFDGLGNTISGLSVQRQGQYYVGLFGWNDGTIRNVGIVGASINGFVYVGSLVGMNNGAISNSYATGAVNGVSTAGGLVGQNYGSVSDSFSTASVNIGGYSAGGLVGGNFGLITNAYAMGSVNAQAFSGGLTGYNRGTISNVFATGAGNGAGLVADNSGTLTNAYWDTQASGISPPGAGTGLTTAQLQGTLPAGFSSSVWGTGPGLYPYLLWHSPISATASLTGSVIKTYDGTLLATLSQSNYSLSGVLSQDSSKVTLTVNGTPVTQPTTGMFSQKDAGNNLTVTVTGLGLNDSSGDVYQLTSTTLSANIGFINPATLTVTANPQTKVYGTADPALTYSTSGIQTGDSAASVLSGSLARDNYGSLAGEQAGSYAIGQGTLAANPDYSIAFTGSILTINPATLTITATGGSKVYDGTTGSTLIPAYTGLVAGDSLTGLTEAYNSKDVPTAATLSVSSYTLSDPSNYTVITKTAPGTITAAPLTVTAASQTKAYDGTNNSTSVDPYSGATLSTATPAITSGRIYGSDSTTMSESFTSANAGAATLTPAVAINDGVGGADYAVTLVNASGTINPRPLALTGSRTYDGTTNASATILNMANVVAGDNVTLSGSGVLTGDGLSNANQTPGFASIGTLALGGTSSANYTLANITTPVVAGSQTLNTVYISFSGVNLTSGTSLTGANLSGLNLTGATLSGQNLTGANLTGTNLTGANLGGANLTSAILTDANLSGATLTGTNLKGDNLAGANLSGANLAGANLSHEDLLDALLIGTNLSGANLSFSNLTDANLTGANTTGANLHGANLTGVIQ